MAEHIDPTLSYWAADRSEPVLECSVGDALRTAAAEYGTRTALVDGGAPYSQRRRWTFSTLLTDAEHVAHALGQRYEPGEHIAVWSPNSPEWILLEFGAALAGLTLVTVNPAFQAAELAYVLGQSKAVGIFVAPVVRGRDLTTVVGEVRPNLPVLREVLSLAEWPAFFASGQRAGASTVWRSLPAVTPDDIAQIQYTSGTTGFPKGAMLRHRGLVNNGRFFARAFGAVPGDVWVNPMPLNHTAGCGLVTLGALQTGGVHVVPAGFDAETMLQLIESERGTITLNVTHDADCHAGTSGSRHARPVVVASHRRGWRTGSGRFDPPCRGVAGPARRHRLRPDRILALPHPYAAAGSASPVVRDRRPPAAANRDQDRRHPDG
jgi:acyl-CoA synthetase (AMP-forming)/AMP-acid ligase II